MKHPRIFLFAATALVLVTLTGIHIAQQRPKVFATLVSEIRLPAQTQDGRNIDELSGLAWNEKDRQIHAISDDGLLFAMSLEGDANKPTGVAITGSTRLNQSQIGSGNAEALDIIENSGGKKGSALLTSYEDTGKIATIDLDTKTQTALFEIPPARLKGNAGGVEAVATLPDGSVAVVHESPPPDNPNNMQSIFIHTTSGDVQQKRFPVGKSGGWRVKAIDRLPSGDFLVLMLNKSGRKKDDKAKLILVGNCSSDTMSTCSANDVALTGGLLEGLALEGMAVTRSGLVILAEDRKNVEGPTRMVFLQLRGLAGFQ